MLYFIFSSYISASCPAIHLHHCIESSHSDLTFHCTEMSILLLNFYTCWAFFWSIFPFSICLNNTSSSVKELIWQHLFHYTFHYLVYFYEVPHPVLDMILITLYFQCQFTCLSLPLNCRYYEDYSVYFPYYWITSVPAQNRHLRMRKKKKIAPDGLKQARKPIQGYWKRGKILNLTLLKYEVGDFNKSWYDLV